MRKVLLLNAMLLLAVFLYSQNPVIMPNDLINKGIKVQYKEPTKFPDHFNTKYNPMVNAPIRTYDETQLGTSFYDLQSNYCLQNRVYHNSEDGTIGVVWTRGISPTSFPGRGTGYNFFDGTEWNDEPDSRIEDERTGWPNYGRWGANGEIVISHLANGLKISTRETKNSGDWNYSTLMGPAGAPDLTWPRMITTGPDNEHIHLISNTYDPYEGQDAAVLYYRSLDGGDTWDIEHELIDGMGSDYYNDINADSYGWADERNGVIAFIVASAWTDMFVMKSEDNGDTWEKLLVWEHPYPFFDWDVTITDTFYAVDNSATVALDSEGKVHVAFGINRVLHDEPGNTYSYFPYIDGIGYWNEDMEPFSDDHDALAPPQYGYANSEMIEDYNYVAWTQDVDGDGEVTFVDDLMSYRTLGISTMPAITVDEQDRIVIIYSSTTETYDNIDYNFKHIWGRGFDGDSWGGFIDLTSDIIHIFDECYFPQVASNIGDYVHVVYNIDAAPGLAWSEDHDWIENRLVHSKVMVEEFFPVSIDEDKMAAGSIVSQNYPNPCTDKTYVRVDIDEASSLRMDVSSLTGASVKTYDKGFVSAGAHYFEIDVTGLQPGVYFYTTVISGKKITRKLVVE